MAKSARPMNAWRGMRCVKPQSLIPLLWPRRAHQQWRKSGRPAPLAVDQTIRNRAAAGLSRLRSTIHDGHDCRAGNCGVSDLIKVGMRGGPACLNSFSASISGASAGVKAALRSGSGPRQVSFLNDLDAVAQKLRLVRRPWLGTLGGVRGRGRGRRSGCRRGYRRPHRLARGGGGLIGCRHATSIAVCRDAGNDEDGNDRGNPNRTAAGGRLSIRIGGGGSVWIAVEAGV